MEFSKAIIVHKYMGLYNNFKPINENRSFIIGQNTFGIIDTYKGNIINIQKENFDSYYVDNGFLHLIRKEDKKISVFDQNGGFVKNYNFHITDSNDIIII